MNHRTRRTGAEFDREVAIGDRVEGVFAHRLEPQLASDLRAVDRKGGSGERRGPEREAVHAPPAVGKARAVALEHLEIRKQVMPESHRLSDLQVGETRHHGGGMFFSLIEEPLLQLSREAPDLVDRLAQPQTQIGCDLIVARAGGEQALAGLPNRKSTRLNSSHSQISYAVFCLKKKKTHVAQSSYPQIPPVQPAARRKALPTPSSTSAAILRQLSSVFRIRATHNVGYPRNLHAE